MSGAGWPMARAWWGHIIRTVVTVIKGAISFQGQVLRARQVPHSSPLVSALPKVMPSLGTVPPPCPVDGQVKGQFPSIQDNSAGPQAPERPWDPGGLAAMLGGPTRPRPALLPTVHGGC